MAARAPTTRRLALSLGDRPQFSLLAGNAWVGSMFVVARDPANGIASRNHESDAAAGEISISRLLRDVDSRTERWAALPIFPARGFVERSLWVARGSRDRHLGDLAGGRVWMPNWLSTHSVWVRIALRRSGVDPSAMRWVIGSPDRDGLPVETLPRRSVARELRTGRLRAAVLPDTEPLEAHGLRRLLQRWVADEATGARSSRVYPAYHVVAIRKDVLSEQPLLARELTEALRGSGRAWWQAQVSSHAYSKATPWYEDELERTSRLLGRLWRDGGLWAPMTMIETISRQLQRDGALSRFISAREFFAAYRSATRHQ